ncbi:MAG: type II toxin-antitoxin system PemK/MazF family toxin [Chloroflexi bacterium]|nr:type II toxin-antitoxin system PemK/MazF family toxin [Chloroflexota bacterium]MBP8056193.1 type II toxin-antitoxin system PemK/MazF family toxin [Chloroflexota bacterium]
MNKPQRGEVWMIDLGMAAKVRPCLVLSIPASNQDRALVTIVPHTTSVRGSRFEVDVKVRFLHVGVFDTQNLVTIPEAKLIRKLGSLAATQLLPVENAVKMWLGL